MMTPLNGNRKNTPQRDAARWNSQHSVGTKVRFWTGEQQTTGKTVTPAIVLAKHALIWIQPDEPGAKPQCSTLWTIEPI